MPHERSEHRRGLACAVLAFGSWGLLPIYFRLLEPVGSLMMLSNRVLWSCLLIMALLVGRREMGLFAAAVRNPRVLGALCVSGVLIGTNWLGYIWAVMNGHVVATSLAYFLNPLVNVLIGVALLGERLRPVQWLAIALAATGVTLLGASAPEMLGIALLLAITFALYGLVRKLTPVSPLVGLGVETVVLLLPALTGLGWGLGHGGIGFGHDGVTSALLLASGVVTSTPLLLFTGAARRLPMVTLGLIQYVTPSMLLLSAVLFYGEHLSPLNWATFALIWSGLGLFAGHALYSVRR